MSKQQKVLELTKQRKEIYKQIEIQEDMAEQINLEIDRLTEEIELESQVN